MNINKPRSELGSLRKIAGRFFLLALPFVLIQATELFLLPIDFFTFRVWESALSAPYRYPGPFYPNLHVFKNKEYGDRLRSGNPDLIEYKPVEWFVDRFGWRNRASIEEAKNYDVVTLGDSNIVGSYLTQRDTLSEVLMDRGVPVSYNYSMGSDHIGLFFSDSRLLSKSPQLLVIESKVGNWNTNGDYLKNFKLGSNGLIELVDRHAEFENNYYSTDRNVPLEKLWSRIIKQPMFHWAKASLATEYVSPVFGRGELLYGNQARLPQEESWRPSRWFTEGIILRLGEASVNYDELALDLRRKGQESYWHTEPFISKSSAGNLRVRFEARNTVTLSKHRLWIFEDGAYRTVGEAVVDSSWKTFDIPLSTKPDSTLEFQIDQSDNWQWLSIRNFHIVGATNPTFTLGEPVNIPIDSWTGPNEICDDSEGTNCRKWRVSAQPGGYSQSQILPLKAGDAGLLVQYEARTKIPSAVFSPVYLFEDGKYRVVSQNVYGTQWKKYQLQLQPHQGADLKIQLDHPSGVDYLEIRNFVVTPLGKKRGSESDAKSINKLSNYSPLDLTDCTSGNLKCNELAWKNNNVPSVVMDSNLSPKFISLPYAYFNNILSGVFNNTREPLKLLSQKNIMMAGLDVRRDALVAKDSSEPLKIAANSTEKNSPELSRNKAQMRNNSAEAKNSEERNEGPFPRPANLTPLDGSGRSLSVAESQYYFYHSSKALKRKADERGMELVLFVMPDFGIGRLIPAINQLRAEGVKVIAYEPTANWRSGVDPNWYWQKADSHWTEAAVRLTADEILRMWWSNSVANRPFSTELAAEYSKGLPSPPPFNKQPRNMN